MAAAIAALPCTTACSPNTMTFPGADTMKAGAIGEDERLPIALFGFPVSMPLESDLLLVVVVAEGVEVVGSEERGKENTPAEAVAWTLPFSMPSLAIATQGVLILYQLLSVKLSEVRDWQELKLLDLFIHGNWQPCIA